VISEGVEAEGTLVSAGPLQLEGSFNGSIDCPDLAVGPSGMLTGEIDAKTLRIAGRAQGLIRCDSLDLGSTAYFEGTLECRSLVLSRGARVLGEIRVGKPASEARG